MGRENTIHPRTPRRLAHEGEETYNSRWETPKPLWHPKEAHARFPFVHLHGVQIYVIGQGITQ